MVPGIREVPAIWDERLRHDDKAPAPKVSSTVRRSIDRQVARILRELDQLPGAAKAETQEAFLLFRARVMTAAEVSAAAGKANHFDATLQRELGRFRDDVLARHRELAADAIRRGVALADVPLKVLGIETGAPPVVGPGSVTTEGFYEYAFDPKRLSVLQTSARDELQDVIRDAREGRTTIAAGILKLAPMLDGTKSAAERVMRTELNRSAGKATHDRMADMGKRLDGLRKRWRATLDHRTRGAHIIANGQERDLDESFDVGGESAMYPRGPGLTARNAANCRCFQQPVVSEDAEAKPGLLRAA